MRSFTRKELLGVGAVFLALAAGTAFVVGAVPDVISAQETTQLDSCTTISEPGTYELTADVEDSDADRCLLVESGGVTLEGNGHVVDGTDRDDAYGVYVDTDDNEQITVQNLHVRDWDEGVRIVDGETDVVDVEATSNIDGLKAREVLDGVRFENVTAYDNTDDGIELIRVTELFVVDSEARNNGNDGIVLGDADDGRVTNNVVTGNADDGIHGVDPDMVSFTDNTLRDNGDDGIYVTGAGASGARAEDMRIARNEIRENGDEGLELEDVGRRDGITVTDNTVCDNADDDQFLIENVLNIEMSGNERC